MDGTLVDATEVDNDCFDRAFQEISGVALTSEIWSQFEEVTARAIVYQTLGLDRSECHPIEGRVCELYLANLRESHRRNPSIICPFAGATDFIRALSISPDLRVAIATGCWRETAQFKLASAGFDVSSIPFACASDHYGRAEIISFAAEQAGVPMERAIYVGDGIWDLRATQKLGIPFIGVSARMEALRKAGAKNFLPKWDMRTFRALLSELQ